MSSTSTLEDLAEQISTAARSVSGFLQSGGHPQPSFQRDAPINTLPSSAPMDILVARQSLIEAAFKLYQLTTGPSEYLQRTAVGYQQIACLRWLCHFNILRLVPLHGSIPYAAVAATANVPEWQLKSIARMAMTTNFLCEPHPNQLAHTATSALLVTNPNFHDWASFMTEMSVPTAAKLVEVTEKWGSSKEKTQTAYNLAFNTELPFFDYLSQSSEKTKEFAGYMKSVTSSEGSDLKHLLGGFDWERLGDATIVDVGGSSGHASIALASAYPKLSFVVQDQPSVVAEGKASLSSVPESISSRISFQTHDFFKPQPVRGASVYLLRMIIHDWPAKEAVAILSNIVPALKAGSRIIVMDSILPQPGTAPASRESLIRVRDLMMMQAFNSGERSLEDWNALFEQADKNLKLKNVIQPVGSLMSVIEVGLDNQDAVEDTRGPQPTPTTEPT